MKTGCSTCLFALHCADSFTPASQFCNWNRETKTGESAGKKEEKAVNFYQPYQSRFVEEYRQLKARYNKLHKMLVRYDAGTLTFKPDCPIELLRKQASIMGQYLYVLETRAEIEGIKLEESSTTEEAGNG